MPRVGEVVIAELLGGSRSLLDVIALELAALIGAVSPYAGKTIGLQLKLLGRQVWVRVIDPEGVLDAVGVLVGDCVGDAEAAAASTRVIAVDVHLSLPDVRRHLLREIDGVVGR